MSGARSIAREFPWLGAASCLAFAFAATAFAYWSVRLDAVPVTRGLHHAGYFTAFLTAWTRLYLGATLAGCVAGALGLRRGGPLRAVAATGLALNLAALAALLVLTNTGSN